MTAHNVIGAVCDSFPGGNPHPVTANITEHGVILRLPLSWLRVGDCVTIESPEGVRIGRVTGYEENGRAVVEK